MKLVSALCVKTFLLCAVISLSSLMASAQGFAWAQGIVSSNSNGNPSVNACTTDGNNNGYFIGMFSGTADFDPGPGTENLTAVGDFDMFILKKDAAGNFLWVKQVVGITADVLMCVGEGIGLDNYGNIYVGGSFRDSFDFDPGPGVYQLSAHGGAHSFVLKLDPAGNFIWVKDMGNHSAVANMSMLCMKMDATANIFFACSIGGTITPMTIDVDPGPSVYNILCPAATGNDILIEKLDSAGNFVWAKQISGPDDKDPWGLALDTLSNVYITGQFRATTDFDPGPGVANLLSPGGYDAFIVKHDFMGNYLWAKQIGSGGDDFGLGIATDTFGDVVVTGAYAAGITDFDPGPGVYNITATSRDMFVLKLRSEGTFAWAKSIHPAGNDGGEAIATDGLGNVYTTGSFFTSADFDPGPGEYWLEGGTYVQKLDSAGNFAWARVFGGEYPTAITLDQANDIYVVGRYSTQADFDPGPGVFTLPGGTAGFIEKLCGASLAISADDSTLCTGQNGQLTTPAISGATYTWTRNDTVISTGSSNTITISQPGVYEVYVDGGCPNASGPLYIYDCTGIEETMKAEGIAVYPNPFDDVLIVKGINLNDQVSLMDITGRVIRRWENSLANGTFTTSDVSPGYYILRIVNRNGMRVNVPVVKK